MDPITASIAIGGLIMGATGAGGGIFTAGKEAQVASQEAAVSGQIARYQMQENDQRRLAMQINARRQQTQTMRQTQQAQSVALAAGVNQGAQFSSGAAGGQAQVTSEGAYNQEGIAQNLQIGEAIFDITGKIDQQKILMSQLQSQQATLQGQAAIWSGIESAGFSMAGNAGTLGKIGNYFGGGGGGQLGIGPMGEPQYS